MEVPAAYPTRESSLAEVLDSKPFWSNARPHKGVVKSATAATATMRIFEDIKVMMDQAVWHRDGMGGVSRPTPVASRV
jgi:hypothetical protein